MDAERESAITEAWLGQAVAQLQRGNAAGAVAAAREVLGRDPRHARAHALLALALVASRRLHAAEHEAVQAIALAPDASFAHHAMGVVCLARRRLTRAQEHLGQAQALMPDEPALLRALAHLYHLDGRAELVLPALEAALALAPDDHETLVAIGNHHLGRGDLVRAEQMARTVLADSSTHQDALVLMGHVLLRQGDVEDASSHARSAIVIDPTDDGALHLLCAVKARTSWFLGVWWRWNTWLTMLGGGKQVVVLLGAYVAYRVAVLAADDVGERNLAQTLSHAWLAFVVYTWVSPAIFKRMLYGALASVRLRADF